LIGGVKLPKKKKTWPWPGAHGAKVDTALDLRVDYRLSDIQKREKRVSLENRTPQTRTAAVRRKLVPPEGNQKKWGWPSQQKSKEQSESAQLKNSRGSPTSSV